MKKTQILCVKNMNGEWVYIWWNRKGIKIQRFYTYAQIQLAKLYYESNQYERMISVLDV